MSDTTNQHIDNQNNDNQTEDQQIGLQNYITTIADYILQYYQPATIETYDTVIDIEQFYELFEHLDDEKRPLMWQIEEAMKRAGFKDEEARLELYFYVSIPEQNENNEENTPENGNDTDDTQSSENLSQDREK